MTRRGRLGALAIITAVMVVAAGAGTAAAFWQAPGTGAGAGSVATTAAITLTVGTGSADLHPGGTATVSTIATNTNTAPVRIGTLTLDTTRGTSGFSVNAAHSGCPTSTFTFTAQSNGVAGWTVPGNGALPISMPGSLSMASAAANACQGVIVTVHLTALP